MRVPLSKVHRAFPELDRFADEQCERFVHAACKRGWRRHAHRLAIGALGLPVLLGALAGGVAILNRLDEGMAVGRPAFGILTMATLGGALLVGSFAMLLFKDWLLRRRIRFVLRDRAVCPACRYSLLGMVVGPGNKVVCPECAMEVEADPSLNELADDGAGRKLFAPSESLDANPFWTPRRKRWAKRAAVAGGVAAALLPVAAGGYELFLRQQAARAASERPGIDAVAEFVIGAQEEGLGPGEPNAWDILAEAEFSRGAVESAVAARREFARPRRRYGAVPYFDQVYDPTELDDDPEWNEENRRGRELAEAIIEALDEQGVLHTIDGIADARLSVRIPPIPPDRPLFDVAMTDLGSTRQWARILAARMELAARAGDVEEFEASLSTMLALTRLTGHQASLIETLVSVAIEVLAHGRVAACLLAHPEAEWLDAIERAIDAQTPRVPRNHALEGERIYTKDAIAWTFADPGRVRLGRFGRAVRDVGSGNEIKLLGPGLGTYAANQRAVDGYFDALSAAALLDPHERPPLRPAPDDLLLLELLLPALDRAVETIDRREAHRRATRVMLALERHYLAHGAYPASLEALVPSHLDALPLDPWSGEAFAYKLLDADGLTYLLYAVGKDGVDDGGDPSQGRSGDPDLVFAPAP